MRPTMSRKTGLRVSFGHRAILLGKLAFAKQSRRNSTRYELAPPRVSSEKGRIVKELVLD